MSRHFRPWTIDQTQLLPAAVVDYVPADHLAQFVVALAREHLDLTEIVASYKSGLGQPPFDPSAPNQSSAKTTRSRSQLDVDQLAPIVGGSVGKTGTDPSLGRILWQKSFSNLPIPALKL